MYDECMPWYLIKMDALKKKQQSSHDMILGKGGVGTSIYLSLGVTPQISKQSKNEFPFSKNESQQKLCLYKVSCLVHLPITCVVALMSVVYFCDKP
jgi:hypothetical protein